MDKKLLLKKIIAKLTEPLMSSPAYVGDFLDYLKKRTPRKEVLEKKKD